MVSVRGIRMVVAALALTAVSARALAQTRDLDDDPLAAPGVTTSATPEQVTTTEHRRHVGRAIWMAALAFGINVAWYWKDANFNKPDQELGWNWPSWKKKIITFEAVRFDSNAFRTNAGSHTEGGTVIYLIGRGNGLGPVGSTVLASAESIVWEYIGEYAEKPSINDLLNNPIGGFAVGEPFYQLSEFFSHGARNGVNQALATGFSPLSANGWMDGREPPRAHELDRLGFSDEVWHRFDLYTGVAQAHWSDGSARAETMIGGRTSLDNVPGYGRPTRESTFFGTGRITRIDAGLSLAAQGMTAGLFATHVSMLGYLSQDLRLDDRMRVVGHSILFSLDNTFDYSGRSRPGLPYDNIAQFGLFGPNLDLSARHGELEGSLHFEAMPCIGMIGSLPADAFKARFGSAGLKSELAERGYYYGYGLGLGAAAAARFRSVEGGVGTRWENFGSVDHGDRYQERLTRNYHNSDGRFRTQGWLDLRPGDGYFNLGVGVEYTDRYGDLGVVHESRAERRATVTLGFVL